MKVLKDPDQVLHIMDAKLDKLHKKYVEADGKEATALWDILRQIFPALR